MEIHNPYLPYKPGNTLITNRIILLPSAAEAYGSTEQLVNELKYYVHKYVDLAPEFEELCVYYILLSWVYDGFNQLGYLRRTGDLGSGNQ